MISMEPYQERVIAEKAELDERIERLSTFVQSARFATVPAAEQDRLARQLSLMEQYSAVLGERISCFIQSP